MKTQESYKLEIHLDEIFDGQPISSEALIGKVKIALTDYLESIKLEIATVTNNDKVLYHRIYLEGNLKDIDECHDKLQKANILCQEPLNFYRYIDEAGEQIRYLAYPILAEIEQKIRGFISRAIAEIWGFNWWSSHPPDKIAQKTDKIYTRNNKYSRLHPLECTTFENLIAIFTAKLPNWQNNQMLTVNDLSELLEHCASVEDIKNRLQEKTKEHSYWDNVFSQYFEDVDKWKQLEQDLNSLIIQERNKVMHHRPMRFKMIQILSEKRDKIVQLIDSAKPELSDKQRVEVKQEIQEIETSRSRTYNNLSSLDLEELRKILLSSPFSSHSQELIELLSNKPSIFSINQQDLLRNLPNSATLDYTNDVAKQHLSNPPIDPNSMDFVRQYLSNLPTDPNSMDFVRQYLSNPPIDPNSMNFVRQYLSNPPIDPNSMDFISHSVLYSEPLDYNSEHVEESPEKPELEMEAGEQVNDELNPFLSDQIIEGNNINLDENIVTDNQDESDHNP